MRYRLFQAVVALLLICRLCAPAQTAVDKPTSLTAITQLQLVDCQPVSLAPCASAQFTPIDRAGKPSPVELPSPDRLASAFTLTGSAGQITPFYASTGSGPDAGQHTNVVLLVIDISGSMLQPVAGGISRFEAAKGAISQFLQGMQDGSDRVAIVPFAGRDVVSTIRSAVFATRKADAISQLRALPTPGARNNTALYQAVFSGSQTLQAEVASLQATGLSQQQVQPHLIVMTDGRNEVLSGDDPLLLNGDLGLQQASAQVQASHLDTIGIGFGERSAIDTAALQRLSTRFFYAADANQLLDALHVSRTASSHTITLTWLLPEESRVAVMGRDGHYVPALRLPDGASISGGPVQFLAPATNSPVFDRRATPDELRALIATHPEPTTGWSIVLVHSLVYLAAALLMLILWFWLPRLIWGERYHGTVPERSRWSSDRPSVTSAAGVHIRTTDNLPPGFVHAEQGGNPLQRSAAQTTQVQPRGEFSKTRLSFD